MTDNLEDTNETLGEISERLDNLNDTLKIIADELYKIRFTMENR